MTQRFSAQVKSWTEKAKRNMELVVKGSIQDAAELMTRRQPGVDDTGGTYVEGRVPVDTGELISSVVVEIAGVKRATGSGKNPPDFTAGIAGMKIGQNVLVAFTAPYARHVEYGTGSTGGRFFVRNAVQQWQTIVAQNAAQFRDR